MGVKIWKEDRKAYAEVIITPPIPRDSALIPWRKISTKLLGKVIRLLLTTDENQLDDGKRVLGRLRIPDIRREMPPKPPTPPVETAIPASRPPETPPQKRGATVPIKKRG